MRFSEALLCCRKHGKVCKLLILGNKWIPVNRNTEEKQNTNKKQTKPKIIKATQKIPKNQKQQKGEVQVSFE